MSNDINLRYADMHFLKTVPGQDYIDSDEELGFLGMLTAIGSAIGGAVKAGKGIAKAAKKKKAKKKAAAAAKKGKKGEAVAESDYDDDFDDLEEELDAIGTNVRNLITSIPEDIRRELTFGLAEFRNTANADKSEMDKMVGTISKQFKPTMDMVMELLKQKQLQTVATNEHNVIVKDDKRWKENTNNQLKILQRLDLLEQRLGRDIQTNELRNRKTAAAFGMPFKFGG